MKIKTKQYARALFESYEEASKEEKDKILTNFVKILKDNNDLYLLDRIVVDFTETWDKNKNIVRAEISSAHKIDEKTEDVLVKKIKELSSAKDIDIEKKNNKKLLGGVVVKYGDRILDSSISTRLKRLQEEFSS
ncbi:MAG: ATP synthase F1 subunit delta [Patescibacteria group bacterium]|jgi:F-type H+-transporting ATPase subunit delta|nr:ATP synthase F1 subunit delta [Patescibacteria group bacterium]